MMKPRLLLWIVPAAAMLTAAAHGETETQYMAVMVGGKKMGHGRQTRSVEGGKVTTQMEMVISVNRAGTVLTIRQRETGVDTAEGKPVSFSAVQDMGIIKSVTEGKVGADGKVTVTVTSAGQTQQSVMDWPAGALTAEGLRLLSRAKGLEEGTTYKAPVFVASLLRPIESEVTIGKTAPVDLLGRKVSLTEVTIVQSSPFGKMKTITYVDKDYDALRSISTVLGMQIEMIACSRQVALSPNDLVDFFDRFTLTSPAPMTGVAEAASATYHLAPTKAGADLKFLTDDSQTAGEVPGGVVVTVRPAAGDAGAALPYKGTDKIALAALKSTRYLPSDDKRVKALAARAVGDARDAAEAVRRIEKFVRGYITRKNLSVGYATAAEVAEGREGDCTEHAVLAAAMCRAAGVPAQVVTGVAYVPAPGGRKGIFGPHAWARALVGQKWVGLDAALGGYGAGHIALIAGDGDPEEFFGILDTLGCFRIDKVEISR